MKARIAQLVEQLAFNQLVLGSSPSPRTSFMFAPSPSQFSFFYLWFDSAYLPFLPEWLGFLRSLAIAFNDADPDDDQTPQDLEEFCHSLAPTAKWFKNLALSVVGRSTNLPCQAILVA